MRVTRPAPNSMMGTDIKRPNITRPKLPPAAAAMPRALSTPITASAITMVPMAPQKVLALCTEWLCDSDTRRQPIQTRASPPISLRPGIMSRYVSAATLAKRMPTAPTVPHTMARRCKWGGKRLAAMPITKALSPARTRSIKIMARMAQTASRLSNSISVS